MALATAVRLAIYRRFLADGEPPSVAVLAAEVGAGEADVEAALRRLDEQHAIVLHPGTLDLWLAQPLSAAPTAFRVTTGEGSWFGTCVWDSLGIPAMLGSDAAIATTCADCGDPLELRVEDGRLAGDEAVAHFAVPAARWWDDLGYT